MGETEPTPAPPAGDCKGDPCALASQCRSQWGYCGTSLEHCNEKSTWKAGGCGGSETTVQPTPAPTQGPTTLVPTPTAAPTLSPTATPTPAPTLVPTLAPTVVPTSLLTTAPTPVAT